MFATPGFHHCRVSDVADEAGVAYGLVYHYFGSKEEILNTLFLERWQIMLDAIAEIDARDLPAREKLHSVAGFIIDSYRHDPDLMKVIIVEVTRAANSFGARHLAKIREAYDGIAGIVETARADGSFKSGIPAEFAAMCFYGAIEQLLTGWIFDVLPRTDEDFERAKELVVEAICGGLETGRRRAAPGRVCLTPAPMDNDLVKAPHVERPARRRRRAHHDRREPDRRPRSGYGSSRRTRPTTDGRRARSTSTSPTRGAGQPVRSGERRSAWRPSSDAFAERPEAFVGAAFAGGFALALILRRFDAMATGQRRRPADKSLGDIVNEVSEKASLLVREEIELAKAEITEQGSRSSRRGAVRRRRRGRLPRSSASRCSSRARLVPRRPLQLGGQHLVGFAVVTGPALPARDPGGVPRLRGCSRRARRPRPTWRSRRPSSPAPSSRRRRSSATRWSTLERGES